MATLALVISLAALVVSSSAQTTDDTEVVWSSFAYVFYGERAPPQTAPGRSSALTALGAQQMYEQGSMFRARYLHPDANLTEAAVNVTDNARIQGIEWNAIDNSQLYIATNTDEWTAESALAFMQGLYPPSEQTYSDNAGGTTGASLADNTLLEFPLDGYQYPKVRTMSILDPESIW